MEHIDNVLDRFLGGFSESEYVRFLDERIPQSFVDNVEQYIPELELRLEHLDLPSLSDYWRPPKDHAFPSAGHARRICSELHDYVCCLPTEKELAETAYICIYLASLYLFCDSHSSTAVNPIPDHGVCMIVKACQAAGLEAVLHCLRFIRWLNARYTPDFDFAVEGKANCELATVSLLALLFNEMAGATWDAIDQFLEHDASPGEGVTGSKRRRVEWARCLDETFGKRGSVATALELIRAAIAKTAPQ